jgi:putative PEP-CTERM system TPR-repeat lipoprotein
MLHPSRLVASTLRFDPWLLRFAAAPPSRRAAPGRHGEARRARRCLRVLAGAVVLALGAQSATAIVLEQRREPTLEAAATAGQEQRIRALLEKHQLDEAAKEMSALEKLRPNDPAIINLRGAIEFAQHTFTAARASFERARALDKSSIAPLLNLADLDLAEHKPEAARDRLKAALDASPDDTRLMVGLALVASALKDDAAYVSWLDKATKTDPGQGRAWSLLSGYYLKRGNTEKALAIAKQAQQSAGSDPQVLEALGSAQMAAGQDGNAVITYDQLVRQRPNDAQAHYKLAAVHAARKDNRAARAAVDRALALAPDDVDARLLLASLEMGSGKYDDALRIAEDLQRDRTSSAAGATLQGDVLMARKDYAGAVQAYNKAAALAANGVLTLKQHAALTAAGRPGEADALFAAWLKEHPDDRLVRRNAAAMYLQSGRAREAIPQFEWLAKAEGQNPAVLNDLAFAYALAGDPRAVPTAEQAYRLAPDRPEIADTLGWILLQQGDAKRGTDLLRRAVDARPNDPAIRYHYAAALAKTGETERARRELSRLLADGTSFSERKDAQALLARLPQ